MRIFFDKKKNCISLDVAPELLGEVVLNHQVAAPGGPTINH